MSARLASACLIAALVLASTPLAAENGSPAPEANLAQMLPVPAVRMDATRSFGRPAGMSMRTYERSKPRLQKVSGSVAYDHVVEYGYGDWGHLVSVTDVATDVDYWRANAINVRGQVVDETLGNDVRTIRIYDHVTGALKGVSSGIGNQNVQQLALVWDVAGNLKSRTDAIGGFSESFDYDNLHRLETSRFTPIGTGAGSPVTTGYFYGAMGQFTSRQDSGTYSYTGSTSAYAPRSLTARPGGLPESYFTYDANGNMLYQRSGPQTTDSVLRAFSFNAANRLRFVTDATTNSSSIFSYTPSGSRYEQRRTTGTNQETTFYVGAFYERVVTTPASGPPVVTHKLYIRTGERVVAEEVFVDGTRETRYWHRDHLESVTAITTQAYNGGEYGAVTTHGFYGVYRYGVWGSPKPTFTDQIPPPWTTAYRRGFGGHEMLTDAGLIHMNGRVYMPELGLFLSPDPFVQFPQSTQNYNRYSYVGNNPLSYTDPSGYFSLKEALSVVISVATAFTCAATAGAGCIAAAVGGGLTSGYLQTGDLGGALMGALGGMMTAGTSIGLGGAGLMRTAITQAVVQGSLSVAGGGRFGDGAISGFVGGAAGHKFKGSGINPSTPSGIIIAAAIGGTAAKLGGGKFANGAITAAFTAAVEPLAKENTSGRRTPESIRVLNSAEAPETFAADIVAMIEYLEAGGTDVLYQLEQLGVDIYYQYTPDTIDVGIGSKDGRMFAIISIDPYSGLRVPGGIQSPALGLYHELVHVQRYATGVAESVAGAFTHAEETTVTRIEARFARGLHEPYRLHYHGTAVRVHSPTCGYGGC